MQMFFMLAIINLQNLVPDKEPPNLEALVPAHISIRLFYQSQPSIILKSALHQDKPVKVGNIQFCRIVS